MKRALLTSLFGCFLLLFTLNNPPLPAQQRPVVPANNVPVDSLVVLSTQLESVVNNVLPAVVSIDAIAKPVKPGGPTTKETGSGVIIKLDGRPEYFIVTNYHVVREAERPADITLVLKDGRILRPTRMPLNDKDTDLAFLMVEGAYNLPAARLGDSDNVKVGGLVLAMGNPFGHGWSVSHGIISARDRGQVKLPNQTRVKEFLQTDAAINPGSSGGPLVNIHSEVVGINTCIASLSRSNSGVGFAVPSNLVKRILTQLVERGTIQRGYLGAQLAEIFDPNEALRLGRTDVRGALVERIITGSPADVAGLRPQDIILAVDNIPIHSESQFINMVSAMPPNHSIRLLVWRNRTPFTIEARIGDWKAAP